MQTKYMLELENYLLPIENIVKKYIIIEDLNYCLFNKKLRYPIVRKNVDIYNQVDISNTPSLSMFCGPMIRDCIKYFFASFSKYKKFFYKNQIRHTETCYSLFDYKVSTLEDIVVQYLRNTNINQYEIEEILLCLDNLGNFIFELGYLNFDHIIEIDDEYIDHVIIIKEHILEKRFKELGV